VANIINSASWQRNEHVVNKIVLLFKGPTILILPPSTLNVRTVHSWHLFTLDKCICAYKLLIYCLATANFPQHPSAGGAIFFNCPGKWRRIERRVEPSPGRLRLRVTQSQEIVSKFNLWLPHAHVGAFGPGSRDLATRNWMLDAQTHVLALAGECREHRAPH